MINGWKRKKQCPCGCMKASESCMVPLSDAETGKRFKVCNISGGRSLCGRMASMGIYPGAEMEIVCGGCGCPCVVRVNGGTLSLGAGVSQKIMVTSAV
ncbi:MAG: FeoA family protein [Desulfoferrobacter sp.]